MERKKVLPRIDRNNPTPEQQAAIDHHLAQGFTITNMKETLLNYVPAFVAREEGVYAMKTALKEKIGNRAVLLFAHAISNGNDCPICGNYAKWALANIGITDFEHFEFTDEEMELIDFAAALCKDPNHVPDEVYEPLQERYDVETMIILITYAVFVLANNYWNNIAGTPIDDYLYEGNYVDREMDINKAVAKNRK